MSSPAPGDPGEASPTYLVVGHITHDVVPGGFTIGGTATFAALTASRLGERVAVVTAASVDPTADLPGIAVRVCPSAATTTYENIYVGQGRTQYLRARAAALAFTDIPIAWRAAPIVHLAPLAAEVDPRVAEEFPRALIGVTPQGWLRHFAADGLVSAQPWSATDSAPILARADVIIMSEEDVDRDEGVIGDLARRARQLVVTRGARGARIWLKGEQFNSAAFACREVDPTGAGDVFAGAYLSRLRLSGDPRVAAEWAHCVASFSVEGPGASAIPTIEQIAARLANGERLPTN